MVPPLSTPGAAVLEVSEIQDKGLDDEPNPRLSGPISSRRSKPEMTPENWDSSESSRIMPPLVGGSVINVPPWPSEVALKFDNV
jgi:hypothetical protein